MLNAGNEQHFLGNKQQGGRKMYIAVCDDDPIFREELRHELYGYLNENHFDPVIEFFDCGETLLSSSRNFDIAFKAEHRTTSIPPRLQKFIHRSESLFRTKR